jgi:amino acid adenylation domain-containing protein
MSERLDKRNVEDILPLTPMQEGMLFHYLTAPGKESYGVQLALRLKGDLRLKWLKKAWYVVMYQNEMLRTVFRWQGLERPKQIILKEYKIPFTLHDLTGFDEGERHGELARIKGEERADRLDLSREPYRVSLCKLADDEWEILVRYHHILYDGWSNGVVINEFLQAYEAYSNRRQPPVKAKPRFKACMKWFEEAERAASAAFWKNYLAGFDPQDGSPPERLPTERRPDYHGSANHCSCSIGAPGDLLNRLEAFTAKQRMPLSVLYYCAWGLILQRYLDVDDVIFGTTVSLRTPDVKHMEAVVGLFINTVPLRIKTEKDERISGLLKRVNRALMERKAYETTPQVDINAYGGCRGNRKLFHSIVVIENYPIDRQLLAAGQAVKIDSFSIVENTDYGLTLRISALEAVTFDLLYDPEIFDYPAVSQLLTYFMNVLDTLMESPALAAAGLDILSEEERQGILYRFNRTDADYPAGQTVSMIFDGQAQKTPHRAALVDGNRMWTYRELYRRAGRIAGILRGKGVLANTIVGILLERSLEMVAGILGIVKAGGAYLPIDPGFPARRIHYLLEDSGLKVVLTRRRYRDMVRPEMDVVDIAAPARQEGGAAKSAAVKHQGRPHDLAYVIYTSGSTGLPKGTLIENRSLTNRLNWMQRRYPLDEHDVVMQKTPFTFDVSVWELFWWSWGGGKLYILKPGEERQPEALAKAIGKNRVTVMHFVPSMLTLFLEYVESTGGLVDLSSLRRVFSSGERLSPAQVGRFTKNVSRTFSTALTNLYGPTEATIDVTYYDCPGSDSADVIPIGKPIDNTFIVMLDRNGRLQPVGMAGQLHIGGCGLARGYVNRPELTAAKFIHLAAKDRQGTRSPKDQPQTPKSQILYRTGDLARWLPDGNIEFLGRIDQQVKISGFRVEPGSIEAHLANHDLIKECIVVDRLDSKGNKYLCAYFVADEDIPDRQLKEYLLAELPYYMVPPYFVQLETIPLSHNGKVDKQSLPDPLKGLADEGEHGPPHPGNEVDGYLVKVWQKVLGIEEPGLNDHFFEVGGNSILLMQMHGLIEQRYPGRVKITDLFNYPTIGKLSAFIGRKESEQAKQAAPPLEAAGSPSRDIAIIGLDVQIGGAHSPAEYWQLIKNGGDGIRKIPARRERDVDNYLKALNRGGEDIRYMEAAYLDAVDQFDFDFFQVPPREAALIDPHQRLFLQTAWRAIEDAGYGGDRLKGSLTGVFVGFSGDQVYDYKRLILELAPDSLALSVAGNLNSILAGRISYLLDLKGPTMVVDTACSSSLAAVHLACRALRGGECELALAGGIKINLVPIERAYSLGIESPDGRARVFDRSADGTTDGEGVGAVLLKSLDKASADGDHIYGVIKGSALNHDGRSIGITAPNAVAQAEVIERAWQDAGVDPETISYIEAHGTGTPLGDPLEIDGIGRAFGKYTAKKQFCAVGSVKSNVGHLDAAAGIAGLVKAVLALKNREIPPTIHFDNPNRKIDFEASPVYIVDRLSPWEEAQNPETPRRCGISAFGLSGTNCHVVLEAAPKPLKARREESKAALRVLTLSARDEGVLIELLKHYLVFVSSHHNINPDDMCYTANTGRGHYNYRLALLFKHLRELQEKLRWAVDVGLQGNRDEGIFYGFHRARSRPRPGGGRGDITLEERAALTETAASGLAEFLQSDGEERRKEILYNLCGLYIKGAEVNWERLYSEGERGKISVPLYPFKRERCWLEAGDRDLFYRVEWQEERVARRDTGAFQGPCLVIHDGSVEGRGAADRLKAHFDRVIDLEVGRSYKKTGTGKYKTANDEAHYFRLLDELAEERWSKIVFMLTVSGREEVRHKDELTAALTAGVFGLFYFIRAYLEYYRQRQYVDMVIVSKYVNGVNGEEERIIPENAALFGLGRVIKNENPYLRCRFVDVDDATDPGHIIREIVEGDQAAAVAYRAGKRYVETLQELALPPKAGGGINFKKEGVYVITGGLGNIGLKIARHLTDKYKVNVALCSRTPLPARDEWDAIVQAGSPHRHYEKIKEIRAMADAGGEVALYAVDITDEAALATTLQEIRTASGRINGIIHCAGLGVGKQGDLIPQARQEVFSFILSPKVSGTWLLDHLTRDDELDFLVMFSSVMTLIGGPGSASYTAANAYMDSFAFHRSKGGRRTVTINWPSWNNASGSAAAGGLKDRELFKEISAETGIYCLERILQSQETRVVVGRLNSGLLAAGGENYLGLRLSRAIKTGLSAEKGAGFADDTVLEGSTTSVYTEVQKRVAGIWHSLLGFRILNIHDNFFEIGGDSISVVKMHRLLEETYPGIVKVTDLFICTTIYDLSRFIESSLSSGNNGGESAGLDLRDVFEEIRKGNLTIDEGIAMYNTGDDQHETR